MNIEEYAENKGLFLLVTPRGPFSESEYKFAVRLTEQRKRHIIYGIYDDGKTTFVQGNGETAIEAINDYEKKISGKRLADISKNLPLFSVPKMGE